MCEHDGNKNVFSKCMQKERKSIIEDYIDEFESLQYAKEYFIDVILEQNQNGDLGPKVIHGTLPNGCPFRYGGNTDVFHVSCLNFSLSFFSPNNSACSGLDALYQMAGAPPHPLRQITAILSAFLAV